MVIDTDDLMVKLREENPDKMLLDDFDAFTRGLLAGKIELMNRIDMLLEEIAEDQVKGGLNG